MSGGEGEGETLEFTATLVVAAVCTVIVALSLIAKRFLHYGGKFLKNHHQKPLYEALQKIKEELMLLGFISLLLTVSQNAIAKICVPLGVTQHLLPCDFLLRLQWRSQRKYPQPITVPNKVPLLSVEALNHLHIFIFVLAIVHVTFCVLTIVFGRAKIQQWKHWEDEIAKSTFHNRSSLMFSNMNLLRIASWVLTHCRGNPKFNFHKYMIRALEDDFKQVVGISWYLWVFVVVFLLLNINGWHTYFWIAFIPFVKIMVGETIIWLRRLRLKVEIFVGSKIW
ncbi:hypothetical protein L6164_002858 [Bauhinia variegata]|uniref:Uncharacterized protein n=1 Tax=Bauhinia variegata TaxID=167791 RepID=A0ACB9Q026_BAUVA|nr:hypothetical protein L6164_002858 [Bauhinia variegata]